MALHSENQTALVLKKNTMLPNGYSLDIHPIRYSMGIMVNTGFLKTKTSFYVF